MVCLTVFTTINEQWSYFLIQFNRLSNLPGCHTWLILPSHFRVNDYFTYTHIVLLFAPQYICSRPSSDMLPMLLLLSCFTPQQTFSGLSENLFTKSITDVIWQPGKLESLLNWIRKCHESPELQENSTKSKTIRLIVVHNNPARISIVLSSYTFLATAVLLISGPTYCCSANSTCNEKNNFCLIIMSLKIDTRPYLVFQNLLVFLDKNKKLLTLPQGN